MQTVLQAMRPQPRVIASMHERIEDVKKVYRMQGLLKEREIRHAGKRSNEKHT